MPRLSRPWYRQQTGCWMAQVNRRQVKLLVGDNTKADCKRAAEELNKLRRFQELNPEPESGQHTVASIIDQPP